MVSVCARPLMADATDHAALLAVHWPHIRFALTWA